MTIETYYVTATWHDFPEGGDCGELIQATSYEEAEQIMRKTMAGYMQEDDPDQNIEELVKAYEYDWVIVDCYPIVDNFLNNLDVLTDAERQKLKEALDA